LTTRITEGAEARACLHQHKKDTPHKPDYAVTPGEVLQETIKTIGMSLAALARRTGLAMRTIHRIIQGREPITFDAALRPQQVIGVPARLWNNLETIYRERLARQEEKD
jgi:addiction module HigA family antidote